MSPWKGETQKRKRQNLHEKYAKAVEIYRQTNLPIYIIAEECNVCVGGLSSYLRRHQRELVLQRYHIPINKEIDLRDIKIIAPGKQNILAYEKYKDAIKACSSLESIEFTVSQIARKFKLNGTALANFMKVHYPTIIPWREKVRRRLGINDNIHRGVRPECKEQYAEAVNLYRTTDMTLPEIAALCHISKSGFSQHLRFYHQEVLRQKKEQREKIKVQKKRRGKLLGNGRKYEPLPQTEEKYARALALYKDSALTMKEIIRQTGISQEGFRSYLHKWHKDLVLDRYGIKKETGNEIDLRKTKCRLKTVSVKYKKAIESLKQNPRPIAKVAAEFGFHPDTFRDYLHKHEAILAQQQGMMRLKNGKLTSRRSEEKYAKAIRLYKTTTENLKSISRRLGLVYNSLGNYIRRNHPEIIELHLKLIRNTDK